MNTNTVVLKEDPFFDTVLCNRCNKPKVLDVFIMNGQLLGVTSCQTCSLASIVQAPSLMNAAMG